VFFNFFPSATHTFYLICVKSVSFDLNVLFSHRYLCNHCLKKVSIQKNSTISSSVSFALQQLFTPFISSTQFIIIIHVFASLSFIIFIIFLFHIVASLLLEFPRLKKIIACSSRFIVTQWSHQCLFLICWILLTFFFFQRLCAHFSSFLFLFFIFNKFAACSLKF
jgi:hypothetical protein